jgi:tetratricopeptide (TPR) repeat protein
MLMAVPMYAQNGRLSGTAKDREGRPLANAVISIERQDVPQRFQARTGSDGTYLQGVVPAGNYFVYLLDANNQPVDGYEVRINAGLTATADFSLQSPNPRMPGATAADAAAIEAQRQAQAETQAAFNEGLAALNARDFATAAAKFQTASEKDPSQHVIFANLAEALNGARRFDDAAAAYQKAIELKPDEAGYYSNMSLVLGNANKFAEATAAVEKAAAMNPAQAAQGWYNLGAIYTNRGRAKEAGDAFLKATEVNPQMAQAWYQLGISYFGAAATIPQAVPALEKFLELQPTGPDADAAKQLIEAAKASAPSGFSNEPQGGKQKSQ